MLYRKFAYLDKVIVRLCSTRGAYSLVIGLFWFQVHLGMPKSFTYITNFGSRKTIPTVSVACKLTPLGPCMYVLLHLDWGLLAVVFELMLEIYLKEGGCLYGLHRWLISSSVMPRRYIKEHVDCINIFWRNAFFCWKNKNAFSWRLSVDKTSMEMFLFP